MFQTWSAHDFETTTTEESLGVRIWTITFRISETYVKDGSKNSDIVRYFKKGLNELALLNPDVGVRRNAKDETIAIYGYRFEDYLKVCESFTSLHWAYFHNLKNFDGYFIIAGLKEAGYKRVEDWQGLLEWYPKDFYKRFSNKVSQYVKASKNKVKSALKSEKILSQIKDDWRNLSEDDKKNISKLWNKLDKKEYSVLLKNNQIYNIKLSNMEWRDSTLLFPMMSIADMGKTLQRQHAYRLVDSTFYLKGETYQYATDSYYRCLEELEKDKASLEYAIQDTFILWSFLISMFDTWNLYGAPPKLTVASTAWSSWLDDWTKPWMEQLGYTLKGRHWSHPVLGKKSYSAAKNFIKEEFFPWSDQENKDWMSKGLYRGGMVGANPAFLGKVTEHVLHLDVTSMYPSISNSDLLLPFGPGLSERPKPPFVSVGRMTALEDMNSGNNMPLALIQGVHYGKVAKTTIKKGESWYLTKTEADMFYKTYGPNWKWDNITFFKAIPAKKILGSFMTKWFTLKNDAKEKDDIALKNASKFPLNGLTGKWGSKVVVPATLETGEKYFNELKAYYTPLVSFITSYGRCMLAEAALGNYDKVLYWDTDALFIHWPKRYDQKEIEDLFNIKISKGDVMLTWEPEHINITMCTLKAKGYLLWTGSKKEITLSGFHFKKEEENKMTFNRFINGFKHTQLQKKRYEKGVILQDLVKEQIPLFEYPHGKDVDRKLLSTVAMWYDIYIYWRDLIEKCLILTEKILLTKC